MSDLIERFRHSRFPREAELAQAADLIEAQHAEIARLRELVTSSEQERYAKCGLLNLEVVQLREAVLALRDGYADAAAGLAYVKQYHGRLSGVGFDRVADRFFEIVTMPEREGLLAGGYHLPALSAQPNDQEQKP